MKLRYSMRIWRAALQRLPFALLGRTSRDYAGLGCG